MSEQNKHPNHDTTGSTVFTIPKLHERLPTTEVVDRRPIEKELGSSAVRILIEQMPFEVIPIKVHHPEVEMITEVPGTVNSTPIVESGAVIQGSSVRGKVVLNGHPNPPSVFGHPSNKTDQQIRNIADR